MADLREKILGKYSIDISQENIFKLYKIDNPDISDQALQEAFELTRKRWNQSINGANERNAERDKARLERADKYEAILKDKKMRKELFWFYNSPSDTGKGTAGTGPVAGIDFAKAYFQLIATTKKLKKQDVEFFFEYYQEERKNKKAIIEMLSKEFKIIGLGKESNYADEEKDDLEGKKKKDSSPLIVNLFQEATIIRLRKALGFYETAKSNQVIKQRFPMISESLYDFLEMKAFSDIQEFSNYISEKAKQAYAIRQENGSEYIPLVDLFNTLQSIVEYRDIVDNFEEFKLLVKYPNLTPYMYAFVDMKPNTLKVFLNVANSEYVFRDDVDFLLNYFIPLHDNFGISDSGISSIIKKAEKKAKANKVLNDIDEKLGRKKKRKISIGAEIVHWLVYFPIFAVYLVFEVFKAIFTELHKFAIPVFAVLFLGENWLFPGLIGMDNLLVLVKIFNKAKWYSTLEAFAGMQIGNAFEAIVMSLIYILVLLMVYILPALLVSSFIAFFAEDLNKRYDWIGYERTFQNIFRIIREKTEVQFIKSKKIYYKDKIKKIIMNAFCVGIMLGIVYFVPIGFREFSEATGYFQPSVNYEENVDFSDAEEEQENEGTSISVVGYVEITAKSANIRSGASTDYEVVTVVSQGTVLQMTGKEQVAANGSTWYELYLNADKTEVGWASEKVLKVQE